MKITVNGQRHQLEPDISLDQLIELLDLQDKKLAIEVNQEIVPRSQYPLHRLQDQDQVEIVQAIGGG